MAQEREYRYEWDTLYLKCTKCWEWKTLDWYYKCSTKRFWVHSHCRECIKNKMNKYYDDNKDKVLNREKIYYLDNKQEILNQRRLCYKENKGKILDKHREYYQSNKHLLSSNQRKYYSDNRERISEYQKENRKNHSKQMWFNRDTFHKMANNYAKRNNLKQKVCSICWIEDKVEMHHPSYEKYEDWSKVVFCCPSCHRRIHSGTLECPEPIDLLSLTK